MATALIVLAAGQGTRMKSDLPKVLHEIAHAPLVVHALNAGATLQPERTIVVAGHGADAVRATLADACPDAQVVVQDQQLGTGHAVAMAAPALEGFEGDAVVLYGDTPFLSAETLANLQTARAEFDVVVLGFQAADPGRYGRLVETGGALDRIVEFKDATADERAITLCNSGIVMTDASVMTDLVGRIENHNAAGEYYLTDIVALARRQGLTAGVVRCGEDETLGVNTRAELAGAEALFQARARAAALDNGVHLTAPDTVFFAFDTVIGRDARIEPNVVFGPGVTVETGATLRAFSHLEGCHVARGAVVGPYARLRPGAELGENSRVGNFVEVKNAQLDEGVKVSHLSYIGDARIGAATNVGAGTITCNYDGVFKHRTEIGPGAFIGSNTMLVAPVQVGSGAMTASGSVITSNVPDDALAVARARQANKPALARRMFERLRALKAKKQDGA